MPMVEQRETTSQILWYDSDVLPHCSSAYFDPVFWQQRDSVTGQAMGRGTTWFIDYQNYQLVLRHYRRGGLMGRLVKDSYLYTGIYRTRAWQELDLLSKMRQLGLPCPRPIAAQVVRAGLLYRADIICQKIAHAQDTYNLLLDGPLPQELWVSIGATIRQFHNAQVYHHDLNIHNIMLDTQQQVWLIDFDKCCFKSGTKWKQGNLNRLLRSLHKEKSQHPDFHFDKTQWNWLMQGYK